ncbi:hypothetical protein ACFFX0_02075 [Citricoccus parietis]|uniref:Uncharacterized protein n=1 Tax=Citricoccus parietis TaxID=592307 RepID=A0ABV5FTR0_9MICC
MLHRPLRELPRHHQASAGAPPSEPEPAGVRQPPGRAHRGAEAAPGQGPQPGDRPAGPARRLDRPPPAAGDGSLVRRRCQCRWRCWGRCRWRWSCWCSC